jgi:hypothetical protein
VAVGAQHSGELGHLAVGGLEGAQIGELRADVDVDADDSRPGSEAASR